MHQINYMWYPDYLSKKTQFTHPQFFQGFLSMHQMSHHVLELIVRIKKK